MKARLRAQYENLAYDPAAAIPELRLNSFTKKYIKNMLARITGYIEEQTGVASNYCNYMNTQTKNPFEIEHIIADHYEWFTGEYADQEEFRRWRKSPNFRHKRIWCKIGAVNGVVILRQMRTICSHSRRGVRCRAQIL